jgi:hypothetical protein
MVNSARQNFLRYICSSLHEYIARTVFNHDRQVATNWWSVLI